MRLILKRILACACAMLLLTASALATDSVELEMEKMNGYFTDLQALGILPKDATAPEPQTSERSDGTYQTFYALCEFMAVTATEVIGGPKTYGLSIFHADLPERLDADELFARFLMACSNQVIPLEEAQGLVEQLKQAVVNGEEASQGSLQTEEFLMALFISATDSEEIFSLTQEP